MEGSQNGWFIMENPKQKWMMTGGTAILGNLQMSEKLFGDCKTPKFQYSGESCAFGSTYF